MDILKHCASYNGKLSNAALGTLKDIAESIHKHSLMSPWDRANQHMKSALIEAKKQSKSKKEFLVNAKKATGLLKNSDPLLVWCSDNWQF